MSRFFVDLIKRVSEKEDVFTECLAAALRGDPELARRFVLKLCGDHLDDIDVGAATLDIATQYGFPARSDVPACCVDMILRLNGNTAIGIENKLFAQEGRDQQGVRNQLRNYLKLGLSRIAYIRAEEVGVDDDVCGDVRRYLMPAHRSHFLWSDFYLDVEACARAGFLLTEALALVRSLNCTCMVGLRSGSRRPGSIRPGPAAFYGYG